MRQLKGWQKIVTECLLVCLALFQLYTAFFGIIEPRLQKVVHLTFVMTIAFLLYKPTKKSVVDKITLIDALLSLMSLSVGLYIIFNCSRLNWRLEHVTKVLPIEVILGTTAVILLIEAVRRVVSPAMAILIIASLAYFFICPYLPEILYYRQLPYSRIIEDLYLLENEGMYGTITAISATVVAIFIIFGAFIESTGVGEFFIKFATTLAGKSRGGPAKIAVLSSGLFGSISGVAVANVYSTGTFSIPLMKSLGYSAIFAGAVEAAASTGGLIMPPIMGSGAFIMAELTSIPYIKICYAAALGAVFYYFSLMIMVHLEASKLGLKSLSKEQISSWKPILKNFYFITPIIVIVYFLMKGFSPIMAACSAIISTMVISFFNKKTMFTPLKFLETLKLGGKNLIMVALACAGSGLIISVLINTGAALSVSSIVLSIAKGRIIIALFLIMITSIILGMGLPCVVAYIIAVSVGGPPLIEMGCSVTSVHLFIFYFSIFAVVTPPVALAAYAGASLAKSDPLKTGFVAFKLALAGFIIPYAFMYNPALLLRGSLFEIIRSGFFTTVAVIILAGAVVGYLGRNLTLWERIILLAVIPFFILPFSSLTWIMVLLIIMLAGYIFIKSKKI